MANETTTKARPAQLIRTDDSTPGVVRFYDRRQPDAKLAFIAEVDVRKMTPDTLHRAARHGVTQNLLDASNKLEGNARVAFIKAQCAIVQQGGWASAPVDEAALIQRAIDALTKLGVPLDKATAIANKRA